MEKNTSEAPKFKKKDFASDQSVKWCPGCGDYAILSSLQTTLSKNVERKEDVVCISGIGCSSRFPYYLNTYGMHTIHGRAPGFATGLKVFNPDLEVWLITGDGDGLSIGGNHLIHALRRNVDMNVILFNNEIYGLTKGQYSPTSQKGTVTKSTPYGSLDRAFIPGNLFLGAGSTYYCRTIDTDPKHMEKIFTDARLHKGTSMIEVYQNCVIFNDDIHGKYTNRKTRGENSVRVEHGQPCIYGDESDKALYLDGLQIKTGVIGKDVQEKDILVHDKHNFALANMLSTLQQPNFPIPIGVIFEEENVDTYDAQVNDQIKMVAEKKGKKSVNDRLSKAKIYFKKPRSEISERGFFI